MASGRADGGKRLRAVIFDVDGVLVQSMERHHEAYKRAFAPLDVDVAQDEVYANEGRRSREVIESIAKDRGLQVPQEQLDAMNRVKQETFFSFGPLPLYPDVALLLQRLHEKGLRLAAVTGTNRQNVDNHLGDATTKFDVIVTADDVEKTKPHPEPYLTALAKLGVSPDEALVVENAPLGIRSAKAAGLQVVAVTSTLPAERLTEADRIVKRLGDVWPLVEAIG